jgi:hypothetical protein
MKKNVASTGADPSQNLLSRNTEHIQFVEDLIKNSCTSDRYSTMVYNNFSASYLLKNIF